MCDTFDEKCAQIRMDDNLDIETVLEQSFVAKELYRLYYPYTERINKSTGKPIKSVRSNYTKHLNEFERRYRNELSTVKKPGRSKFSITLYAVVISDTIIQNARKRKRAEEEEEEEQITYAPIHSLYPWMV